MKFKVGDTVKLTTSLSGLDMDKHYTIKHVDGNWLYFGDIDNVAGWNSIYFEKVRTPKPEMVTINKSEEAGLRMYFFVMYNLSGIQKGIQAGHAAIEYQLLHGKTKTYKNFARDHKTFILLDGGGSEDMIKRYNELEGFDVKFAAFKEPDLNNSISAIAFIVPEYIYNCKVDLNEYEERPWYYNSTEVEFFKYLKSFRLASN
jgi:hypothetical protein